MENKILTFKEARAAKLRAFNHKDGVYKYKTKDDFWHLIIDGVDVLEELRATRCYYYGNGFYASAVNFCHSIIDGVDVLEGLQATHRHYYLEDGVYKYEIENEFYHLVINGVDVLEGLGAIDCYYNDYENSYVYQTEDNKWHKLNLNKD